MLAAFSVYEIPARAGVRFGGPPPRPSPPGCRSPRVTLCPSCSGGRGRGLSSGPVDGEGGWGSLSRGGPRSTLGGEPGCIRGQSGSCLVASPQPQGFLGPRKSSRRRGGGGTPTPPPPSHNGEVGGVRPASTPFPCSQILGIPHFGKFSSELRVESGKEYLVWFILVRTPFPLFPFP